MTKRTWIIVAAVGLPVVFVAGVLAGSAGEDAPSSAASTTVTRGANATSTSSSTAVPGTSTTVPSDVTSAPSDVTSLPPGWASADVVDVVDGDTIEVRLEDGSVERLRLIGTNSPEGGECFADEATSGLAALVLGETVHLEPDVSDRDQFGRLLRYVWTRDDRFVNEITVEQGWAIAREYPPDTARAGQLETAQDRAREDGAGLWAPEACGVAVPADVQITHVEFDAPADDNFNLNGEWAEITNAADVPVVLADWVLKDETASHRFTFPDGLTLEPGVTIRVFTGCGEDTAHELYWCNSGSAIWNNSGDTAFLVDPAGNIVYSFAYG